MKKTLAIAVLAAGIGAGSLASAATILDEDLAGNSSGLYSFTLDTDSTVSLASDVEDASNVTLSLFDSDYTLLSYSFGTSDTTVSDILLSAGDYFISYTLQGATAVANLVVSADTVAAPVPLPAAAPMLLAAIGGLGFVARRKRKAANLAA